MSGGNGQPLRGKRGLRGGEGEYDSSGNTRNTESRCHGTLFLTGRDLPRAETERPRRLRPHGRFDALVQRNERSCGVLWPFLAS